MTLPKDCSRDNWPPKAYRNIDFLNSDPARNIRILCEMTEPGLRLRKEKIAETIVLFGSARLRAPDEATSALKELEASLERAQS